MKGAGPGQEEVQEAEISVVPQNCPAVPVLGGEGLRQTLRGFESKGVPPPATWRCRVPSFLVFPPPPSLSTSAYIRLGFLSEFMESGGWGWGPTLSQT